MSEKEAFVIRNGVAVPVHLDKELVNGNTNSVKWTSEAEKRMVQRIITNRIKRAVIAQIIRRGR